MKDAKFLDRINAVDPVSHRETSIATTLGVTIAFTAGSLGVIAFLIGLSALGFDGGIVGGNPHLFQQGLSLVAYAIFAGLLVDFLRFLGDLFFGEKNPSSG